MQWLLLFLAGLADRILSWFTTRSIKAGAVLLTYFTFIIGLFTAFLALTLAAINGLQPLIPAGMGFILSMLPPSTTQYISAYLTVLTAKRVYDWHAKLTRDFTQTTMGF